MRSLIGIALVAALAAGAVWYFMATQDRVRPPR